MALHPQDDVQSHSLDDPDSFWAHQATQLHWHKKPSGTLKRFTKSLASGVQHPSYTWFPGGQISTTFNCVDRHVLAGNGDSTAIIWDSPVTGRKQKVSYAQLLQEVETLAAVLREEGVKKGDVVLVYSVWSLQRCERGILNVPSAHDPSSTVRHPCHRSSWRNPYRGVWRFCSSFLGSKDRGFQGRCCIDSIMWDRRGQRADELQAFH